MSKRKPENNRDTYKKADPDNLPWHDIIRRGRIGIMPIGALSLAFAYYIEEVDTFIESKKTHYSVGNKLKIQSGNRIREIVLTGENYTNNINSLAIKERLPEVILFSPPNHRLISVLDDVIDMINNILERRFKNSGNTGNIDHYIPKFVMLSNGIYFDEVMSYLSKILIMKGVKDDFKEQIKGNFIRGTTMQTGTRLEGEESLEETVFAPGTKSNTIIADGSKKSRERVIELFNQIGLPVSEMEGEEVRRIEFDKAIVNLSANAVQLSLLYDEEGKVHSYTLGDLVSDKNMQEMCKKIIYTMVSIGVKAGIYKNGHENQNQLIEKISRENWKKIEEKSKIDNVHIVSSIAAIIERYRKGKSENKPVRIPPLEENIINYLLDLSNQNNLVEEKKIIEDLRDSILRVCYNLWC